MSQSQLDAESSLPQKTIIGHRFLGRIDVALNSNDPGAQELALSIVDMMVNPFLGEDVKTLQAKLDKTLIGHAKAVRQAFEERYPNFGLDRAWACVKAVDMLLRLPDDADDAFVEAFVNVTAWAMAQEGGKRRFDGFPLIKLCGHIGQTADFVRACVAPVEFETICGVCGGHATVKAHSASLKRTLLNAIVECASCHHKDVVTRPKSRNVSDAPELFQARLDCMCATCVGIRNSICESAAQVDSYVARTVAGMAQWFLENKSLLIPSLQDADLSKEQQAAVRVIEQEIFERNGTLADAMKRICLQEYQKATSNYLEDYILNGILGGYLKAENVRLGVPAMTLEQDIQDAIEISEDWDDGYSLSRFVGDLENGEINSILHGCLQFLNVDWINSPVIADIVYVGSESGILRQMAGTLHGLIATIEGGGVDPAVQVALLKEVRDRLLEMAPRIRLGVSL